jgi:aspartyl-tRNA(Asn)/glutamyl-tRNA(Gln) amidotransferase subunit C
MAVTSDDVQHVATLARLEVGADQVQAFGRDLDAILGYFEKLDELDTSAVEPMSHALDLVNVVRTDTVVPSLPQDEALANAPEKAYGHFRVPKVIE